MMQLTEKQKQALKLILRSPTIGLGWRKCSAICWPLLDQIPAELIERQGSYEDGGVVKLTRVGEIVAGYLV